MSSTGPVPEPIRRELSIEQAHVDRVYAQLDVAHGTASKAATEGQSMYQYSRTDYLREEDSTAVFERDAFSFQAAKRLAVLDSEHDGLVFGRLDHSDGETRYIGRIGVRDDEYEPLVLDWRAPASEPFYRATPADPMTVTRRRVLRCRGETVVGIEDDLLDRESADQNMVIVGEGALMASLARARGPRMKDIVATIQAEQDTAIRAPHAGVTIISGGPGTGKTVVALHRAAYLLYSHRKRLQNGGVLVVGPSEVFMNYIDRVLPSLGEDSVTLRSVGNVSDDVVAVHTERMDGPEAAAVKGGLAMVEVLRRLVADPLSDPELELRVVVKGEVLTLKPSALRSVRKRALSSQLFNRARSHAQSLLVEALWQRAPEDLDCERDQFEELVCDQAAFVMFLNAWWPRLTPGRVLERLADRATVDRVAGDVLDEAQRAALCASVSPSEWSVADAALLDEVHALIGPVPPDEDAEADPTQFLLEGAQISELVSSSDNRRREEDDPNDPGHQTYAHVLVDEAQDITPMQWRMLRRRGSQASWTIVGDPAQSSWPVPEETAQALEDLIGSAPHRRFRMSTNYRSPAEVFDLAAEVVQSVHPDADLPQAVRRTGVVPMLLSTDEAELTHLLVQQVRALGEAVEGSIGIIGPMSRLEAIRQMLLRAGLPEAVAERVVVVSPLQAKGLEYDAVVVVDPDGIVAGTSGGVRILYVALTRPTQRLVTIDVSPTRQAGSWRQALSDSRGATA